MRADLKRIILFLACVALGLGLGYFLRSLGSVSDSADVITFEITSGSGFQDIARQLEGSGLIRSSTSFVLYALATGSATELKAGKFELAPSMTLREILRVLQVGEDREAEVRIPEGATVYQVDRILSERGVLPEGTFLLFLKALSSETEGRLFPDTYRLFKNSPPHEVLQKMRDNFEAKAAPLFAEDPANMREDLILSSLIEKEIPDYEDRRIVAGILRKRLEEGMPLQVDATICYVKQEAAGAFVPCIPITQRDLRTSSPYNTYLNKGLPPGPIGSPGLEAIKAALDPKESPYWYYLSDPATGRTIFSRTLDEHTRNRVKYLESTE